MSAFRILLDHEAAEGADPDGELVSIRRAELEGLRAEAAAPRAVVDAPGLAQAERRAADWERAYKSALKDRELATALAGKPLVPGAAAQLVTLWRDEFEVHEVEGEHKVVARNGRTVGQAVADRLASPDYAHFCRPTTRGGTAQASTGRPTAGGPATAAPRTLGDAIIQRWREAATARPDDGSAPIGLRRRR